MKRFKNKKTLVPAAIAVLLVVGFFTGPQGYGRVGSADQSTYKNLKIFTEALEIIERNYVEKVEPETLIQGAINGMVKSLDPHSAYLNAEMYKELQSDTKGYFGGIGIEITMQNDLPTVVSPIEDTPAFVAGVKAGDQIIKIDDKPTKGITIMEAVKKLRGPENTKVKLTIMRKELTKSTDITIKRAVINVNSVKSKVLNGHIGYIRISAFTEKTSEDVKKALAEISKKAEPLEGIVLDMRNNPGGLLDQSVKVSDLFLTKGGIVSIRGKTKSLESRYSASFSGNEPTCPMVVLVNEGSASAAEIVAGALQDNGRALVLGTQTFGKASVQTVIPFENGSALKLTTAKYYTPNGRSIQAAGIMPDIIVEYARPVENEAEAPLREKDLAGHIKSEEEKLSRPQGSLPLKREYDDMMKDNQLKSAVDLLKGWKILKEKRAA